MAISQSTPSVSIEERFWRHVNKNGPVSAHRSDLGPCWIWGPNLRPDGYGQFRSPEMPHGYAHRWAYEKYVGPIPAGLELDHLCHTRACVNPSHLEPVTHWVNVWRGAGHGKETHCPQGHPYDLFNTRIDKKNRRNCRICHTAGLKVTRDAAYWRAYRAKRTAEGRPVP